MFQFDVQLKATFESKKTAQEIQAELQLVGWELTKDTRYSFSLISPFVSEQEIKGWIIRICRWISDFGKTTSSSIFELRVKAFSDSLNVSYKIDPLKLFLSFEETKILGKFQERLDSGIVKSIKNFYSDLSLMPGASLHSLTSLDLQNSAISISYNPEYFVSLKYIGGLDYQKEVVTILEILNHFTKCISESITSAQAYTDFEKTELYSILHKDKDVQLACKDYQTFKVNYPKINLTINLERKSGQLNTMFQHCRQSIVQLIRAAELASDEEILLNYDSERGMLQLKETAVKIKTKLYRTDLIVCRVTGGEMELCQLYGSVIKNSRLDKCFLEGSAIENCKINNSLIEPNSICVSCEITGRNSHIKGELDGTIVKNGVLFKTAKVGDFSEIQKEVVRA